MLTLSIEGKSIIYIHLHGHMQHAQVASEYISDAMRVAAELIVKVGEIITKIKRKLNCWWPAWVRIVVHIQLFLRIFIYINVPYAFMIIKPILFMHF